MIFTHIYALIHNQTKVVLYVGQSLNPDRRHKVHKRKFGLADDETSLVVLRWLDIGMAHFIESQIIRAYKRKGQCPLNLSLHPTPAKQEALIWRKNRPVLVNGSWEPKRSGLQTA